MVARGAGDEELRPGSTLDVNMIIIPLQVPSLVDSHCVGIANQDVPAASKVRLDAEVPAVAVLD